MDLELFLVGSGLVLASSAMFIWRSLPPWLLAVIVFALTIATRSEILGIHLWAAEDAREACRWQCDALYGHRSELASQFALCVGTCR